MENFRRILEHNRAWAAALKESDPDYFAKRAERQEPHFLYIGCADSRVPSNAMTGTEPGELFVHRNIANLVLPSDLNAMCVLQYAIEVLDVKHVMVTGHYGCAGVKAAMGSESFGLVDYWLGPIRNVIRWNKQALEAISDERTRFDRVVELNVLEQIYHLSETPVVQRAWAKGRRPLLHGLVYDIYEGLLREIATGIDSHEAADALAERRLSSGLAGPFSQARGTNDARAMSPSTPVPAGEAMADQIAARVTERRRVPAGDGER